MALKDLTGQRFGRLLVIGRNPVNSADHHAQWDCLCDPKEGGCGKSVVITSNVLTRGTTVSCGCYKKENSTRHGMSGTGEYNIWKGIKQRCYNKHHHKYKDYGARGITMCDEWKRSFEAFYQDMGPRPSPEHSIDRRENDKGYSKDNCHWATDVEQSNNTRRNIHYLHNGVYRTLAAWCREFGLNYYVVHSRLQNGWSFEKAITTPIN